MDSFLQEETWQGVVSHSDWSVLCTSMLSAFLTCEMWADFSLLFKVITKCTENQKQSNTKEE